MLLPWVRAGPRGLGLDPQQTPRAVSPDVLPTPSPRGSHQLQLLRQDPSLQGQPAGEAGRHSALLRCRLRATKGVRYLCLSPWALVTHGGRAGILEPQKWGTAPPGTFEDIFAEKVLEGGPCACPGSAERS